MGDYRRGAYHGSAPNWRATRTLKGQYIGIELEVYNRGGYRKTLAALPNVRKNQRKPITEEDGSLSDSAGVEIIFPPYKYSQLRNHRSFFHTALAEMQKAGAQTHSGYGMHMNVNTGGWQPGKRGAFCVVVSSLPSNMIENIGGRRVQQNGTTMWTQYCNDGYNYYGRVEGKPGRLECRFPQSCLDSERVTILVDFIALVERFAGSKKNQQAIKKIVEDTIKERNGSIYSTYDSKERWAQVTNYFMDWLDAQSKKKPAAKYVMEVLERGYETVKKKSGDSGESASPAKPWRAGGSGGAGKDCPVITDEEFADIYDESADDSIDDEDNECDCDICNGYY